MGWRTLWSTHLNVEQIVLTPDASLMGTELEDQVVVVDAVDVAIGVIGKLRAHTDGVLHRAFSIFVFRDDGAILLQRRARTKYHSGGLWTNTCCSHPRPGEDVEAAARRRLHEEMGFDCPLTRALSFAYRAELVNGLVEHELDHVFTGRWNGTPHVDPSEVEDWLWCSPRTLTNALHTRPQEFTVWLPLAWAALQAGAQLPSPR
jgi:isopentenyl-diphosphate Delta-isomerase